MVWILLTDLRLAASFTGNLFYFLLTRVKCALTGKKLVVISLTEHLGDLVAAEPIAAFIKAKTARSYICWVVVNKYADVVRANPAIDKTVSIACFSEWIMLKQFLSRRNRFDLHINNKVCDCHGLVNSKANPFDITYDNYFNKGNLLYAFSRSGGIEIPDSIAPTLYLQDQTDNKIKSPYIVLHTSANHPEKMWRDECWNRLAQCILDNFADHSIVEIGFARNVHVQSPKVHDLTGERELEEIAGIIKHSKLFIGIDSGFAHFANALNKDALVLIGRFGSFVNYMPYSGKFQAEKEEIIHYHAGPLSSMPCDEIFAIVSKKLSTIS